MLFVFANSGLFLINLPTSIKLYSFSNKFVYISIGSHQRTKRVKTATELAADFHQVAARLWTHSRSWSLDPNSQFWRAMRSILSFSRGSQSAFNAGDHGQEDSLQKEMATHSSTLAWRIPWTEEPGKLQSMGSQKVT